MTFDKFRAYVAAQEYLPNQHRWCIDNNVNRGAMNEYLAGRRTFVPTDLAAALGFTHGVIPIRAKGTSK